MRRILIICILLTVLSAIPLFSQPATSYEEAEKWGKSMFLELDKENVVHPMQYMILTNRSSFGKQVLQPNTIYEIQSAIDLQGATVCIPERCVLLFNGGSLKNGRIVGNETQYCMKTPSRVFACDTTGAFTQVAYIVKASETGLIKNNANKAGSNFNILKQLIQRGSNLYLDGKYYVTFSKPIELGRVFSLYGGELIYEKNAFRFTDGGGLSVRGSAITTSKKSPSAFFIGSNDLLGAQTIQEISFLDSSIDCAYLVQILFKDLNSDNVSFGVKRLEVDHCVFSQTGRIRILDAVISDKCSFTSNHYKSFATTPIYIACQHSVQVEPNDKSAYRYVAQNLSKGCPVVIDHNIFIGKPVSLNFYYCAALVKAVDCSFTNNYLRDIINYCDGVDNSIATAYDAYLSCVRVLYEGNFIKDMMSYSKKGGRKPQCQIGKSKSNPLSYVKMPAVRIYRNNCIIVDGNRFLKMGADSESLYAEIFHNISYFDKYVWSGNTLIYKNADIKTGMTGSNSRSFRLENNYFDVRKASGSGLVTVLSNEKMDEVIVRNNVFRQDVHQLFPLLNQKYKKDYKKELQGDILITGNRFINSSPKTFYFTGKSVVIKDNDSDRSDISGNTYLSNFMGSGTNVDVDKMNTELKFRKKDKNTAGLFQYFSSASKGIYSIELDAVPEKGVSYYYELGKDHDFVMECEIKDGRGTKVVRIPFHYKRGRLSYEWEGKTIKVQPGDKSDIKIWFKDSFVQFRTSFPASGKKQMLTQIRPGGGSGEKKAVKFTYRAE